MEAMMTTEILQLLGPGGAAAMLTIYLMEWRNKRGSEALTREQVAAVVEEKTVDMCRKIEDLHSWHSKEDEDGVKVWYVRRSLENAITRLADAVELLTRNQERTTLLLEAVIEKERDVG